MNDERRRGDERPLEDDPKVSLTFWPAHNQPIRWLPRHGAPLCILEWGSQHFIRIAPTLTLVVVSVSLLLQILAVFDVL